MKRVICFLVVSVLLLLSSKLQDVGGDTFHILTALSNPCPTRLTGDSCLTLQQLANSPGHSSSVELIMESGNHSLSSTLSLSDMYNLTMVPRVANDNVRIICSTGSSTPSISLTSISHVFVQGISFDRCISTFGTNGNSALINNLSYANGGITIRNMTDHIQLNWVNFTDTSVNTVEKSHAIQIRHVLFSGGERITTGDATSVSVEDSLFQDGSRSPLRLYASSNVSVIRCHFIYNNRVSGGFTDGSKGGGVYIYNATVVVNDSSFQSNYAYQGSAIYGHTANLVIDGTNFTGNTATLYGSISLESGSNLTVVNSIFDNNRGAYGAAIDAVCVYVHITGSSFTRNVATYMISGTDYGVGGVLDTSSSTVISLTNCSFYDNSAVYGGTIYDQYTLEYVIEGCLFTSNVASKSGGAIRILGRSESVLKLIHSSFVSNRASLDGGAIFTTGSLISNQTNFTDNVAARKGGAVHIASIIGDKTVSVANCYFINNNGDTGGGGLYVKSANTTVNVYDSHFAHNSVSKASGGVIQLVGKSTNISLVDSTFERNTASSCAVVAIDDDYHHSVRLVGSKFTSNRARGTSVGGGVLCVSNASISLTRCSFSNNSAAVNAGVLKVDDSSVKIDLCSFDNNSAHFDGGVVYTYTYPSTYSIRLSTFANNSAGRDGGVLYVGRANSHVTIERSSFSFNHAVSRGGAVAIIESHLDIDNLTNIYNNIAPLGAAASACNSIVTVPHELNFTVDHDSICKLYDGYINRYNISNFVQQELSATTVAITTVSTPPITSEIGTTSNPTTTKVTGGSPHSTKITSETINYYSSPSSSSLPSSEHHVTSAAANSSYQGPHGASDGNNYAMIAMAEWLPSCIIENWEEPGYKVRRDYQISPDPPPRWGIWLWERD